MIHIEICTLKPHPGHMHITKDLELVSISQSESAHSSSLSDEHDGALGTI